MTIIMTSAIGKFKFEDNVLLSSAKLVRDSIVGQMLAPKQRSMRVETEEDAYAFIRAYESDVISKVVFELDLSNNGETAVFQRALLDLVEASRVTSRQVDNLAETFNITKTAVWKMIASIREMIIV